MLTCGLHTRVWNLFRIWKYLNYCNMYNICIRSWVFGSRAVVRLTDPKSAWMTRYLIHMHMQALMSLDFFVLKFLFDLVYIAVRFLSSTQNSSDFKIHLDWKKRCIHVYRYTSFNCVQLERYAISFLWFGLFEAKVAKHKQDRQAFPQPKLKHFT